ncbi:rRNA maturation RNase YbeY [Burkholderia stagnalis]|uniref:Endoribonuclease YbeY n=1 Tax=Burkholderia stagnalis TaxID=1503054 RepID=A0A6L3MRS0_9BURK|nr:rRNA maturation RNase YbeY [Burkholderia stagnalis]KAB0635068.1 rRNA maturation RNase YbeY [Burkholderia stagnalis]KVO51788.1 rRNA maturation RNase YbeY [Burkholderia stagnalis]KVO70615.1 rRNA maturation RNase YbeY [Burkholderia stagnalis]KVW65066.1 rRNA maturation RNase YbeY [Burkholderia stagnalis]KVW73016.1 rRNA maturation RNase YbeY [Burkholderia stagnalis]
MKSSRSSKSARADKATSETPRLSLFDAKGKVRSIDASGLRIDFADGRSLMFDLSGSSGEAAVAIVAQHTDPAMRAKLALQPEHYDSVTLHVGAEPAPRDVGADGEPLREPELDLAVQYGDGLDAAARKALPKRKLIAEWIAPALFADAQLTVRFVGEEEGRALNDSYRHKDYPTNVLTFAYDDAPDGTVIGDLVLCCPVVEKEAHEQGKPLVAHYAHLLVHGALHAQGYDHETSDEDAAEMEALEVDILAKLGFPNPYR